LKKIKPTSPTHYKEARGHYCLARLLHAWIIALNLSRPFWLNGLKRTLLNWSPFTARANQRRTLILSDLTELIGQKYSSCTFPKVRDLTRKWIKEYNDELPHELLNDLTSWEYLARHESRKNSNLECH